MFFQMDGMCLHFDNKLTSQGEDPLQAAGKLEGHQREEEVEEAVAPGQHVVHTHSVEAVPDALLTGLEGEVSTHEGSRW